MSKPSNYLIDAQGLCLQYRVAGKTVTVLREVSLQIASGTTLAIAGPSGSGKTSLFLLLAELEQPDARSIEIDGLSLSPMSPDALADVRRDRIGFGFDITGGVYVGGDNALTHGQ